MGVVQKVLDWLGAVFSPRYYIQWVEILVILGIVVFMLYISHALNLFKKE
jgi:hypothetical protein